MSDDQRPIDTLEGQLGCGQQVAQMVLIVVVGLIVLTLAFGTLAMPGDEPGTYKFLPTPDTQQVQQEATR